MCLMNRVFSVTSIYGGISTHQYWYQVWVLIYTNFHSNIQYQVILREVIRSNEQHDGLDVLPD